MTSACVDSGEPLVAPPPDLSVDQLLAVPETTMVEGRRLYLYTSIWRDFMPVSPPNGGLAAGIVVITALDSLPIADAISSDALWIVYQRQVWSTWFSAQAYPPNPSHKNELVSIFNGGPKWGPGVFVDVVARIIDRRGNMHLLRASKQLIGRTD